MKIDVSENLPLRICLTGQNQEPHPPIIVPSKLGSEGSGVPSDKMGIQTGQGC